jgi:hypothetical protein
MKLLKNLNLLSYVYVEKLPYLNFRFSPLFGPLYHAWTQRGQ